MVRRRSSGAPTAPLVLGSALVAAIGALISFAHDWRFSRPEPPHSSDAIAESGIDFRTEQRGSEQFKTNLYDHGSGVAIADYDGDGFDDVLFLTQFGENRLYHNGGNGTFENVTKLAGPLALADRICVGAAFGDYDNDGDQDLYITSTRGGNAFFENQGGGRYLDATERAGVVLVAHSQTPAFFDYDNDGYLDLFVTNTARWTTDEYDDALHYFPGAGLIWTHVLEPDDREFNVLFRNNRDGTFSNVTSEAGLSGKGWGGDVAAFDYDEDGDIDVVVTNMFGASQLYRNDGHGHFEDVTLDTLGKTSWGAIGAKVFDFDNDAHLDLFITDMHSDMWIGFDDERLVEPQKKYDTFTGPDSAPMTTQRAYMLKLEARFRDELGFHREDSRFGNTFYRRSGTGQFTEISDAAGIETFWPWGIAVGDFNNDGYEDVFIPSGMGFPFFYWPNALMMNNGDGTFTDRANEAGIEPPRQGKQLADEVLTRKAFRSSRCAATADFDGDGQLELMVNNFNDAPYYFRFNGHFPLKHWVAFRLRGTQTNRDAIGAVVKLFHDDGVMVRQVHCTGGYLSQSSKTVHFGLGDRTSIDRVEIRWPSGAQQTLSSPEIDELHEVTEPEVQ